MDFKRNPEDIYDVISELEIQNQELRNQNCPYLY